MKRNRSVLAALCLLLWCPIYAWAQAAGDSLPSLSGPTSTPETPPGTPQVINDLVWNFVASAMLPALIAVINRPYWSSHTKTCVSLLCTMLCAMGMVWLSGKWDVTNIGLTVMSILVFTEAIYRRTKGLGWTGSIERNINPGTPLPPAEPTTKPEEG